jgi:hypothetical protein
MGREGSTNLTSHFTENQSVQKGRRIILKMYPYKYILGSNWQYQQEYRITV